MDIREKTQEGLDKAYVDGVALMYEKLVSNRIAQDPNTALQQFRNGMKIRHDAYLDACCVVESDFPREQA